MVSFVSEETIRTFADVPEPNVLQSTTAAAMDTCKALVSCFPEVGLEECYHRSGWDR